MNRKVLVCYTGKFPHIGGISTHIETIYEYCKNNRNISFLFSNIDLNKISSGGNSSKNILFYLISYIYRCLQFYFLIKKSNNRFYSKYVCHDYFSAFVLTFIYKNNVSIVIHGELANELVALDIIKKKSIFYKIILQFELSIYKKANQIICVDQRISNYIQKFNLFNSKIITVNNFLNLSFYDDFYVTNQSRLSTIEYIYCSRRLVPKNGIMTLLKAYKILIKEVTNFNLRLIIAGDGYEKDKLLKYSNDNNLDVIFLGDVPYNKNLEYLKQSKISVVPSIPIGEYVEATSYSMLEAMSLRIPLIVSNVGGLAEVILHNYNGFIFNHSDEVNLSESILEIVNLNSTDLRLITDNAYKTVYNNHNVTNVINKIYLNEF
jgi:glycosyltransferase involved in cell wall biosynthesis